MKIIVLTSALCCLISGGDIPGVLKIENRSDSDISYVVYQTGPNGKEEKVELSITLEQKMKDINIGWGQFGTKTRIREYASSISRLEIISTSDTLVITDTFQLWKRTRRNLVIKSLV